MDYYKDDPFEDKEELSFSTLSKRRKRAEKTKRLLETKSQLLKRKTRCLSSYSNPNRILSFFTGCESLLLKSARFTRTVTNSSNSISFADETLEKSQQPRRKLLPPFQLTDTRTVEHRKIYDFIQFHLSWTTSEKHKAKAYTVPKQHHP